MLHGLLPGLGAIVLNPPSWSISLEWQFYIIAPFIYFCFRKSWVVTAILLIVAAIAKDRLHPSNMCGLFGSCLLDQIIPFSIGMISYQIYKIRDSLGSSSALTTVMILIVLGVAYSEQEFIINTLIFNKKTSVPGIFPVLIWLVVLLSFLGRIQNSNDANGVSSILAHKAFQFLGRISYSLYLVHQLVIFLFLIFFGSFIMQFKPWLAFCIESVILIPITVCLAWMTNTYIEKPFIDFGKRLARP
jgi:peptidoglycan/LPS O-acetylase OafA/YrhL